MFPEIFRIGDFSLATYGVLVALGFVAGLWVASRLSRRAGLNSEHVVNLGMYVALSAMVGAKLLMVVWEWRYWSAHPEEIFSITMLRSGGVFFGGLIASLVVSLWYLRSKKLPALVTSDAFAPGIALGHAIGRLGCLAAGCCWGKQCALPWAVTFTHPEAYNVTGVPLNVPLHPTQLYESLAEFLIFGFLYWSHGRPHRPGQIIGLYLVLYSVTRFFVEFVRAEDQPYPFGGPLSMTQWIALALLATGVWLFRLRRDPWTPPGQPARAAR